MSTSVRLAILLGLVVVVGNTAAAEIAGQYMETRSCQVYTGPCFANAEMGLAGKDAVMAWSIREGTHNGVDLAGLKVVMALTSTTTLGHNGLDDGENLKSVIYIDEKADSKQSEALVRMSEERYDVFKATDEGNGRLLVARDPLAVGAHRNVVDHWHGRNFELV